MNIPQLKWLVREQIARIRENQPTAPSKPKKDEPAVHPGTPEKPKKRRPLTPPKTSPQTSPKAEGKKGCGCGQIDENEEQIVKKITQRFKAGK